MRWPFGPPHLTLKHEKEKQKKTKKKKEKRKKRETKENKGKNKKKTKIPKKELFSYQSIFSFIFWCVSKISLFLTTWPKKRAPKRHYKNRGFGNPFFGKQFCVTKRPCLDKKTNPEIPVIIFLGLFFFSFNNKKHKN